MPLPLVLIGLGAGSAALGVGKGIKAAIDQKDAKEKANKKGKGQIMGKPKQRTKNGRVNKKIIDGAHNTPCKRKTRTNDSLNVSPFTAIVPETDVKPLQRNDACNIF